MDPPIAGQRAITGRFVVIAVRALAVVFVACAVQISAVIMAGAATAQGVRPPRDLMRLLPPGYDVLSTAIASAGAPAHAYYIVALDKRGRDYSRGSRGRAPARPLLVFEHRPDGSFLRIGRNDHVILRADEGGQCDPFLDGGGVIAVKGRTFTVENGVACGSHWTDEVTFRFDHGAGQFVFDTERLQSWSLNRSTDPDADALVADGPPDIRRGDSRTPLTLDRWRRAR